MLTFDKQVWWVNMQNLLNDLVEVLQHNADYVVDGKLAKNIVVEKALQLDSEFLQLLLTSDSIKEHFFKKIGNVLVFDKVKFQEFVSNKEFLPNSYTSFRNQIGLVDERGSTLKQNKDVVLTWAYKDCVLEGGQDKEDVKRDEIFYNETLAPDEITRLFESKVLTNFEKWDMEAVKRNKPKEVNRIEDKDSLLIKGNNLLALHCLKSKYANQIKLIYLDPPYNTGNDGFKYNDSFNHSTWLTFMKNRLEIAKELLSDDGCILVQIDNSPSSVNESPEYGYLLILLDEIFDRRNYLTTLVWKKKGNPSNTLQGIGTITESILMYCKNIDKVDINLLEFKRKYKYEENGVPYNLEEPVKTNNGEYQRKTMIYPIKTQEGMFYPPEGKRWTFNEDAIKKKIEEGKYVIEDGKFKIKKFPEDYKKGENKLYNNLLLNEGSLKNAKDELADLGFDRELFDSPKPEILMKRLIDMCSKEADIVLDFFAGSGTTAAVAHKMGRKWIAIEQMDYIKNLPEARMKKVLIGEQGGISKDVSWQGGGEFIYCELKQANEIFVQKIRKAQSKDELISIYNEMKEQAFMRYEIENFDMNNFSKLDFDVAQKVLLDCLDKNHLYVNLSEIDDSQYDINSSEKAINKEFYKK